MSKILLVEDDNNLREIYEARLQAEGYDIVSARDGEEALTVAMKERPDLIISDVMMPKISGFDMLDIIRSTEETKNVKVIMMTALSQAEDKERATKLGADRYLVKSQVTLEDVAKVAREVLNGDSATASDTSTAEETPKPPAVAQAPTVDTPVAIPTIPAPSATPVEPTATTATTPQTDSPALTSIAPTSDDDDSDDKTTDDEQSAIASQIESFIETNKTEPEVATPAVQVTPEPTTEAVTPELQPEIEVKSETNQEAEKKIEPEPSENTGKKVIQPISDPTASKGPDLEGLLAKEAEKEQMAEIAKSIASEKSSVAEELAAEAALRSAARDPKTNPDTEPVSDTPQVAITENGELKVETAPEVTLVEEEESLPVIDTSDVPKVEPTAPVIPHSNGASMDGVVAPQPQASQSVPEPSTPQTTPASAQPAPATEQSQPKIDPNSIAL
jgi:CheY-like chemotaxis protein